MIVFPNAKINIGLHIVSRRPDGYHNLETVFFPAGLADALEMIPSETPALTISGIPVDGPVEENLILKAWHLLNIDFNIPPARFHLHKKIPPGAGLGGGSSDAAFTLRLLNDYFTLGLKKSQLKRYAAQLGADCPFFIDNQPAFASGTGTRLKPQKLDLTGFQLVLLKPACSVSTREAYRNVQPARPHLSLKNITHLPVEQWKNQVVNDFEKSILPRYPEIKNCKDFLYEQGALYASMSGSGSAVFGIFCQLPAGFPEKIPEGVLFLS